MGEAMADLLSTSDNGRPFEPEAVVLVRSLVGRDPRRLIGSGNKCVCEPKSTGRRWFVFAELDGDREGGDAGSEDETGAPLSGEGESSS